MAVIGLTSASVLIGDRLAEHSSVNLFQDSSALLDAHKWVPISPETDIQDGCKMRGSEVELNQRHYSHTDWLIIQTHRLS